MARQERWKVEPGPGEMQLWCTFLWRSVGGASHPRVDTQALGQATLHNPRHTGHQGARTASQARCLKLPGQAMIIEKSQDITSSREER